ncbi:hypothetical protein AVEN_63966-1 [Araneus ventricosus]|uniref:Uncharacterized protein n=1 Tax=Araneus ventricosus TaxID=182803 RepID=A0A4Y2KBB7_ARAVE|nr:hypothetical protein AVEN_63966-1 [Araneus ventricosus]
MVRVSLPKELAVSRRGTAKGLSRVCGVVQTFRRNVGKYSDIKGRESTDGDPIQFLRAVVELCIRRGNGAAGRIPIGN